MHCLGIHYEIEQTAVAWWLWWWRRWQQKNNKLNVLTQSVKQPATGWTSGVRLSLSRGLWGPPASNITTEGELFRKEYSGRRMNLTAHIHLMSVKNAVSFIRTRSSALMTWCSSTEAALPKLSGRCQHSFRFNRPRIRNLSREVHMRTGSQMLATTVTEITAPPSLRPSHRNAYTTVQVVLGFKQGTGWSLVQR